MSPGLDTEGLWETTLGMPEQLQAAADAAEESDLLPDAVGITSVVIVGMGTSGLVGDVIAHVAGPMMPVPVMVVKGYSVPGFVGPETLVMAVSASGNTEETLEASGLAAEAGARMVILSGGGKLAERAGDWSGCWVPVGTEVRTPRAAVAALIAPGLVLLDRLGLFPGGRSWVAEAAEHLLSRRDSLSADRGEPAELARRIGSRVPLIYGAGGVGSVAARRWKTQCNENAKAPAFSSEMPELCHNELSGWGQHGDVTRQVLSLVMLRHAFEHPQVEARFDFVENAVEEVVGRIDTVVAEGEGPLAQLLDLVLFGDLVSLHMAFRAGVDPGPVPVVTELRTSLSGD